MRPRYPQSVTGSGSLSGRATAYETSCYSWPLCVVTDADR